MSSTPRSGVALIIAISVLAALLFLALPFLYSQSSSLAGARSAAYDGEARRGQATAAGLAAGLAVYAQGLQLSPDYALAQFSTAQLTYSQISQVCTETRHPGFAGSDPARTALRFDQPWTQPNAPSQDLPTVGDGPVTHGATVEDQSWISGRMDPLAMDAVAWAKLFRMAGISDPVTVDAKQWIGNQNIEWQQNSDGFGRLAYGLEQQIRIGGQQIRRLDQLTSILPQHLPLTLPPPVHTPPWQNPPDSQRDAAEVDPLVKADPANRSFRTTPLSLAEVERLRPYLAGMDATSHTPAQARAGIIDLGNVVLRSGAQYLLDANQPRTLVPGDRILGANGSRGWVTRGTANGLQVTVTGTPYAAADALGVMAIPAVNINALPASQPMVRWFQDFWDQTNGFQPGIATSFGWPTDPLANPIQTLADLPRLYLLDPRAGDGNPDPDKQYLRPPVAVTNWGIVAVDSAATARDAQGRIQAQRRQRTVVQAVPQERPIEARWHTQAEFESLVRQRHGSWVVTGPHPTNRIKDWGFDLGERHAIAADGWLEAAPHAAFTANSFITWLWRRPLGLGSAVPWSAILDADILAPIPDLASRLQSDGLHLESGDRLAWKLDGTAAVIPFAINGDECAPAHISLRFRFDQTPTQTIDLVDVLGDDSGAAQSRWRVWYDPTAGMLVMGMANAALPWSTGLTWRSGSDRPGEDEDARCNPGGAYDFAPASPASQVEFRYKASLATGRWYHLQAYYAGDRPGQHGLLLDGIAGRDAWAANDFSRTGDHYTFPSLRLKAALDAVDVQDGNDLIHGDLIVQAPPSLTVSQVLPTRGLIRIGDEFLSYDAITGDMLQGVQRGRRVASMQDPMQVTAVTEHWPTTQDHEAGAEVLPGWTQMVLTGGWQTGSTTSAQVLGGADLSDVTLTAANPSELTVLDPQSWPTYGMVRFANATSAASAYVRKNGTTIEVFWQGGIIAGTYTPTVCSLQVDSVAGFASSGHLQLLDAVDGRCEWIRYTGMLKQTAMTPTWTDDMGTPADTTDDQQVPIFPVDTAFFIHEDAVHGQYGWPEPTHAEPMIQARGAMRTPVRTTPWLSGTTVLPVQRLAGAHRFESGDVATLVAMPGSWFAPQQIVVRHAARDGYPYDGIADASYEVDNNAFALTAAVSALPAQVVTLVGRGWNGADRSTHGAVSNSRRGQNQRRSGLGLAPRLVVGSPGMTVDDLGTSQLPGVGDVNRFDDPCAVAELFTSTWDAVGNAWVTTEADLSALPVGLRVDNAGMTFPGDRYGLLRVGEEVFAYRPVAANEVELFARAQLGSMAEPTPAAWVQTHDRLRVLPLPMGPVGELAGPWSDAGGDIVCHPAQDHYRDPLVWSAGQVRQSMLDDNDFRRVTMAPAVLISATDGSQVECLRLLQQPYSSQLTTAPWLRGLYGTTAVAWSGTPLITNRPPLWVDWNTPPLPSPLQPASPTPSNPVIIGWWPRFAPAMPAAPSAQHLRSRSHAWAGFALRLHGSRFDPTIAALAAGGVAEVALADSAGCTVTARALAAGEQAGELFDWDKSPEQLLGVGLVVMPQKPFQGWQTATERFVGREVDGAELRLYWQMPVVGTGLEAIANAQGRAPRIGTVRLRCVAPTRILSVEEVR